MYIPRPHPPNADALSPPLSPKNKKTPPPPQHLKKYPYLRKNKKNLNP